MLRGLPIAFLESDFTFYDNTGCHLLTATVIHNMSSAAKLNILFRCNKSGCNYTTCKFSKGGSWLCPILAAISILSRARLLRVAPNHPIFIYRNWPGTTTLLRAAAVMDTMQQACLNTYPAPTHYMHLHLHGVTSHSNRVTATVALWRAGLTTRDIAFRLRWKPESVEHYIRKYSQDVDEYTAATIAGATKAEHPQVPDTA